MSGSGEGVLGVVRPRADVSVGEDGRLVVDVQLSPAAGSSPQLLFQRRVKKGQAPETGRVVALECVGGDRWQAVLEAAPAFEEGRWDVYVVGVPGEERMALLPGLRDLRELVSGGGRVPLAVRIPYVTKDGRLAVRAWMRAAHAEAGRIVLGGGSVTVAARLLGARLGEGASVSLVRRGQASVVREAVLDAGDGQDFSFTVGCRELAPGGGEQVVWDVFVRPALGAPRVRVARLLDDIADRKGVFVYPVVVAGGVSARVYYTVDNDLSVEVSSSGTG
ncbi:hypothetical protein [Streptomyces sp. NBC_01012]|uniref:hypothetical protein n=1 Tax=Streptomyces sp. NBC_01012 TaxID=2903717 RepID=UPI003863033C|nr:hypothetical protein OG623_00035 [Streptomyces sp. NBC_01012]